MNKLATRLVLVTALSVLGAPAVSFAAPPGPGGPGIDCKDPANAKNPACMQGMHKPGGPGMHNDKPGMPGMGMGPGDKPGMGNPPPKPPMGNPPPKPPMGNPPPKPPMGNPPPPPGGNWNFSQHDRDQFRQRFHGFNFGFFPVPNFSINLGVAVPHSYTLKPVPRGIYRDYPQFRGYLYFVSRNGDIVIVSPRSYRIVAIL